MEVFCGRWVAGVVGAWAIAFAAPALADPCKAIPDRGPAPAWIKPGARFSGLVRYVGDGDSLCVGASTDPGAWVEVRLEDFYAPELSEAGGAQAKAALARLSAGRQVECTVPRDGRTISYDRVIATCRVGRRSLGDSMRTAGIHESGRGWNP